VLRRNRAFSLPGVPGGRLDQISVSAGGSAAEQTEAVIAGTLDVMIAAPPRDRLPELRSELSERYSEHPALETDYLAIRSRGEVFGERGLREALALAIDKPEVARRVAGLVHPTCNMLPPALPGYDERDPCPWGDPMEHPDLIRARDLVEQAGYLGMRVTVSVAGPDRSVGRLYLRTLRKIGLAAAWARSGRGDVRLRSATAPVADPASFLVPLARRVPLVVDAQPLLTSDELRSETDPDERAKLAEKLDSELVAGGVVVPYARPVRTLFLSERIDAENCSRYHPVYGIDLSNLCLR
jgi:peptide/nickel transport system substrate-binding protein